MNTLNVNNISYTKIEYISAEILDILFFNPYFFNRDCDFYKLKKIFSEYNLYHRKIKDLLNIEYAVLIPLPLDFQYLVHFIDRLKKFNDFTLIETPKMKFIRMDLFAEIIFEDDLITKYIDNEVETNFEYNKENKLIKVYQGTFLDDAYYFSYRTCDEDDFDILMLNTLSISSSLNKIVKFRKDLSTISQQTNRWHNKYNEHSDCIQNFRAILVVGNNSAWEQYKIHIEYENSKIVKIIESNYDYMSDKIKEYNYEGNNIFVKYQKVSNIDEFDNYSYKMIYNSNNSLTHILYSSTLISNDTILQIPCSDQ